MAINPTFTSTPRIGVASVSTANTNRDGTGTVANVITGVAAGTKIFEVALQATGDVADSVVNVFLHDGSSFWLFDSFDMGDPAAGSTTVESYRVSRFYDNLILPSTSWSLRASITVAPTSGVVNVFALGGDLS